MTRWLLIIAVPPISASACKACLLSSPRPREACASNPHPRLQGGAYPRHLISLVWLALPAWATRSPSSPPPPPLSSRRTKRTRGLLPRRCRRSWPGRGWRSSRPGWTRWWASWGRGHPCQTQTLYHTHTSSFNTSPSIVNLLFRDKSIAWAASCHCA